MQQLRGLDHVPDLGPLEVLGRALLDLLGVDVAVVLDVGERDLDVVEVEEPGQQVEDGDDGREGRAEGGARHARVPQEQHQPEDRARHREGHVEVGRHELEVLVEVRRLLRGDQHRAARRADEEVGRVDHERVRAVGERQLGQHLAHHHQRQRHARADHVDELRLEHAERHPRRAPRVDLRQHHLPRLLLLLRPDVLVQQHHLQARLP